MNAQMRAVSVPESTSELLPAISDDIVWNDTFADQVFKKHPCRFRVVDIFLAGEVGHHLRQLVNDY